MSDLWMISKVRRTDLRGHAWLYLRADGTWMPEPDSLKAATFPTEADADNAIIGLTLAGDPGDQFMAVKFEAGRVLLRKLC